MSSFRFVSRVRIGFLVAFFVAALASPFLFAQDTYKIVDRWTIGGEGGWDYLVADGPAHRLYLAHNVRVEVVDTETGKLVGAITGLHGTHGIALSPDGATGYISDGAGNAIVIFDRSTLATLATVPAGTNPDAIVYEPVTRTVWAFNGRSKNTAGARLAGALLAGLYFVGLGGIWGVAHKTRTAFRDGSGRRGESHGYDNDGAGNESLGGASRPF